MIKKILKKLVYYEIGYYNSDGHGYTIRVYSGPKMGNKKLANMVRKACDKTRKEKIKQNERFSVEDIMKSNEFIESMESIGFRLIKIHQNILLCK